MSSAEVEHRPAKKRRFFVDDPEDIPEQQTSASADTSSGPTSASSANGQARSSQTDGGELESESKDSTAQTFDIDTFRAFTGEDVDPDLLQKIRVAANDDMERGINMYLDGSWKGIITHSHGSSQFQPQGVARWLSKPRKSPEEARSEQPTSLSEPQPPPLLRSMPRDRYVGAFGVAAWSTKSGANLIKHGDVVKIERTKIAPKTKIGRGGKAVQVVGRNQKADVITRFTSAGGDEIGRLPEETAKWVSTLLDQRVCRFEGTCVYTPDRLRVNDTIYLQLRCYMLRTAFEAAGFVNLKDDNRATGIFEEKESAEEKDLRLRQVALVTLFDEVNLHPTTTDGATAKHKKKGILRAAEMAELYEKDKSGKPKPIGASTPPSEEEDGEELEEDQLDALYKKAQSFDFNTPEAEPPDTFTLNLRKYQKQALHWMLSKEKDQKSERQLSMHPLWEEYTWPTKDADDKPLPVVEQQDKFFVNLYSGELSLDFPVQEQNGLGGILADEMGLGKTIEMFSLIQSHKSEVAMAANSKPVGSANSLPRLPQMSSAVEPAPCTTLVVAPMSLLAQWESEAVKASKPGSMKTLVYYGNEKTINLQTLCSASNAASAPHVIITSYGTVLSEFNQVANASGGRGSHGGLFSSTSSASFSMRHIPSRIVKQRHQKHATS